ncbi:dual specificity protein phosphatase family protein [Paracoccus tegillarcae]|uniref:Protein tyrosine phosphatase n=1 Tax=Paracoccus tegillarcae TaxID=1529068 RepID=A0A2K9F1A9_9RHOB|nr:dual specificity protein phosphatase family protein [Paracoccus tegillarcae]AUH32921.1 protein tyrosine phosphatase [Paracoccus tegillarcae]
MRRLIIRTAKISGVALVCMIAFLAYLKVSGNFHAITPGQAYRAAQMGPEKLVEWTAEHGIASVLNLRGENEGTDWYDAEVATADKLGITHINFRMSASQELTGPEAQQLIQIMRDAPKPMLIHCQAGADRTGLAAALYVAGIEGGSELSAEWQLSPRYGHIGIPWISAAWPMDETWERIEPWLGYPRS